MSTNPIPTPTPQTFVDEITPIAEHMVREMTFNASSEEANLMNYLNSFQTERCEAVVKGKPYWMQILVRAHCMAPGAGAQGAAMSLWTYKVGPGQVWDHKPQLRRMFPSPPGNPLQSHRWANRFYFYDIWSNIHYGFVGIAAGFSEDVLLDGAGLAQFGSDAARGATGKGEGPTLKPPLSGRLRDWDSRNDRKSIALGVQLRHRYGARGLTAQQLVHEIVNSNLEFQPATK